VLLLPRRSPLFPYTSLFRSGRSLEGRYPYGRYRQATAPWGASGPLLYSCGCIPTGVIAIPGPGSRGSPSLQLIGSIIGVEPVSRSEEHTSELQSREKLVCRL